MANHEVIRAAAARDFMGRFSENWQHALSQSRPWRELVDRSCTFAWPQSLSDAKGRIRRNISYFRLNYALLFTGVFLLTLIRNSLYVFLLCGLPAAWLFAYPTPLNLFNRNLSGIEVFPVIAPLCVIVIYSITSALMSVSMLGAAIICVHAACCVRDDPCANDPAIAIALWEQEQCRLQPSLIPCVNDEVLAHLSLDDPCVNDEVLARLSLDA